jgi:ribosome biogenesis GTPase
VLSVDRGRYRLGTPDGGLLTAVRARELGRRAVVVGDRVAVVGDTGGGPDALGRIVAVETRTSLLRRTPDDSDPVERAVVANAEVLVVVTALADPVPRPRLVDRCLVAAYDGGLVPVLCLTKDDLASPDEMLALYEPLGVEVVVTGPAADDPGGPGPARAAGPPHERAVRPVGVGKSTLVNRSSRTPSGPSATYGRGEGPPHLVLGRGPPAARRRDGHRHPGVRSFGLGAVTPEGVLAAFPDLAQAAAACPPGCTHLPDVPGCALDAEVAAGRATAARLDSLRRLLTALAPGAGSED